MDNRQNQSNSLNEFDKIKDVKFKDIFENVKSQVTADIKEKLLLQLDIRLTELNLDFDEGTYDRSDRSIIKLQLDFFRKITNDL